LPLQITSITRDSDFRVSSTLAYADHPPVTTFTARDAIGQRRDREVNRPLTSFVDLQTDFLTSFNALRRIASCRPAYCCLALRALDFRIPNDIMKIDIGKIDAKEDVEAAVTYECLLNVTTSISSARFRKGTCTHLKAELDSAKASLLNSPEASRQAESTRQRERERNRERISARTRKTRPAGFERQILRSFRVSRR